MPPTNTTGSIASLLSARLIGRDDLPITSLETMDRAGPQSLTFIRSASFAAGWRGSKAAAALITSTLKVPEHDPSTRALLVVDNADLAMTRVLQLFAPPQSRPEPGVHPAALVDATAKLGAGVAIGPNCVIGAGSVIGDGAVLHAGVYIGASVKIGPGTVLHPHVRVLDRCAVGAMCILWPGTTIGADGFGYLPAPDGKGLVKIPHIGSVEVGNGVEIGANTSIDRGKFGSTLIGDGTKIDNLVQIGHNCRVGRACIICGHSGIAGSVTIGDGAVIAGRVGIADNLTIGPRATVAAGSGVMNDIGPGETWFGYPARPHGEQMRNLAAFTRLSDVFRAMKKAGLMPGLKGADAPTP
ncbi:MAG: UDP-3-O-(3-hydroxymyristoyl)glucosamine N-acyltransferase [Phycisphaeraceae bacterium]|nr:UDP-3-O-(3-hydroxymyristoyl)glucosamine N-acyltransferase [Phycisphaeraceae bacterium]